MIVQLPDLRDGYVQLVTWLMETGYHLPGSRGGETIEHTGVTLSFEDPEAVLLPIGVGRRVNTKLAAVEALELLAGEPDHGLLQRAAPSYADVLVDPSDLNYGSYGLRLRYQLSNLYALLASDPETRRAVLSIWHPDDLTHDGDRPCTLTLQFLLRNDHLDLIVNMRSQDVWLGVPYDVFMFNQLQRSLARQLGVAVGRYLHHVGSLHLYTRDFTAASGLHRLGDGIGTYVPDADLGYPDGVAVEPGNGDHFTEVASYLLNGTFSPEEAALNPWYVRQLAALRVTADEHDDASTAPEATR